MIGVNAFLDALSGPASEIKLHVIWGQLRNLQEAVADAEVDAVMEAENKKTVRMRDVRVVGSMKEDPLEEMKKLEG